MSEHPQLPITDPETPHPSTIRTYATPTSFGMPYTGDDDATRDGGESADE